MKTCLMSMRITQNDTYKEMRNSIAFAYVEFFEKLGYTIVLVPNGTTKLLEYFRHFDPSLVVLSGGDDIDDKDKQSRFATEAAMVEEALKRNVPIIGICRGLQMIAKQLYDAPLKRIDAHVAKPHTLQSPYRFLDGHRTNSFHNFGIFTDSLPKSVQIVATKDDIVEAFYDKEKGVLALQWHPERQNEPFDVELVEMFLQGSL